MSKILLLGDVEQAKFHPLTGFDVRLKNILSEHDLMISTDYNLLSDLPSSSFDACILMIDQWIPLSDDQTHGLMEFIYQGRGLLAIHQGISIQARPELELMMRGHFTHHPEQCLLTYSPVMIDHPILVNVKPFTVKEEPYRFILDQSDGLTILLTYAHEGMIHPAAWVHTYGKGRICYVSPGHNLLTLFDSSYTYMIQNSIRWLTK